MNAYNKVLLNGSWVMQYISKDAYDSKDEPTVKEGFEVQGAVPAYWEDLMDKFRSTPMHTTFNYNPSYTLQRYPQAGYVPDMCLPNIIGSFAYNRKFSVDLNELSGEKELFIGGAQNAVSVWINGKFIACREGYSSPFSIPITDGVLLNGENTITLAVSNLLLKGYNGRPVSGCTNRAANECTGGIYGDVELRSYKDGIKDVKVKTAKDLSCFTVTVYGNDQIERKVEIIDNGKIVYSVNLQKGETKTDIAVKDFELWSPDNPKRYTLQVKSANQTLTTLFGIRSFAVAKDGIHLTLNGEPYFFRGICEHGYYPFTVHPTNDKNYYRKGIKKLKKLGFNSIRFHTWVPVKEYLEAADELGMLIEVETPNNTSFEEWKDIVYYTTHYTSTVLFSSGNEMVIDEDYIEHLRKCADLVHTTSDALFSPMSAMRGIEYFSYGNDKVDLPFPHNPVRLKALGEFCDLYNSYSVGRTSYWSEKGHADMLDERNAIYNKPLLSHEICIQGTYCDLSLKDRYRGTRIGDTELYTSVERHLIDKGLIDRAPLYYNNSCEWQRRLRKHCFETVRRANTFAGYDFLGDIDHHWHTFGYCVGMMNEFYELKPSETEENVLRYNSPAVLLADLPDCVNFVSGQEVKIPILVSNYDKIIPKATLCVRITDGKTVYLRREIRCGDVENGKITKLYDVSFKMPKAKKPAKLSLIATLGGGDTDINNVWETYVFLDKKAVIPSKNALKEANLVIADDSLTYEQLVLLMESGKKVLLFGNGPFAKINTAFQMALAGRTEGHLATVINDHPLMQDFAHDGFCSWQFRNMLNEGYSAALDNTNIAYKPIIEIASSYKYARREALLFEYAIANGRLLVCTLNLPNEDVGARYLKGSIIKYAMADFKPEIEISIADLYKICHGEKICVIENTNEAFNANDITM